MGSIPIVTTMKNITKYGKEFYPNLLVGDSFRYVDRIERLRKSQEWTWKRGWRYGYFYWCEFRQQYVMWWPGIWRENNKLDSKHRRKRRKEKLECQREYINH